MATAMVSVAVEPATGMPTAAMVCDNGGNARIITDEGDLPGASAALERMNALYREAGKELHPIEAFDLFSAAYGWKAHPPVPVNAADFPSAVELTRANLAASYGTVSLARQAQLRQVSQAWDQRVIGNADAFSDDKDDAVAGLHSEVAGRYVRDAGLRRKFTAAEKTAALAFLDEWLDEHPLEVD